MILGLEIGKTVWPGWIVWEGDLRDDWSLWWIYFEHCEAFGRYARLLLKHEIVLKSILSSRTRVDIKEL